MTPASAPAMAAPPTLLTSGPILPALVRLALPNMLAMIAAASVTIAETAYIGILGREPLAAMAVVFPFVMMMQMFSAGSMGGAISSAISRALGAQDAAGARALSTHAVVIGGVAGLAFSGIFLLGGPAIFRLLGARGEVLAQALRYANTLFAGIGVIWLTNSLISVIRGTGNMRVPSVTILLTSGAQVVLGAALGLGWGPVPRLGMVGVALGQLLAYGGAMLALLIYLRSRAARLPLALRGVALRRESFMRILRVGLLAMLSPLQTILIVMILTALVARIGTDALAGYGIGVRLEFLLIPIAFGVGVATVPMVGMAIGRGDVVRARRVAWIGGALSAGIVGAVGLVVSLWPELWARLFTSAPQVVFHAEQYLRWAGPAYPLFGLGLTLFFASQGAGKVLGPVLASTMRLAVVAIGGGWLASIAAPSSAVFALVGVAMAVYGTATAWAIHRSDWRPKG